MPRHKQNPGAKERKAANAVKALELRIRGLPYRKIGDALGVTCGTAYKYVRGELDKIAAECREQAGELQTIELERLDDAITRITSGEAYRSGDPQTINTLIRLSESRRKLLGLDAPAKTDLTSGGESIKFYGPGMEGV